MSKLIGIPANMLTDAWASVEPFIVKACAASNGRFVPSDFAKAIADRDMQLWGEQKEDGRLCAAGITRIVKYPHFPVSEFLICVGDNMAEWRDHMSIIEDWARAQGCKQNHLYARPGWARVMKQYGYEHTHSLLEKVL